ncbi:MAG: hypothetical protein HDR34_08455 [Treponema sp.]|nr:hypothetical protein [Treponema sp.]
MRKILAIFKTPIIHTALFCAVFCAIALCSAQETARGIVAEKIGTVQNSAERAEPEIRFVEDYFYDDFISISSDLKFIVFSENFVSEKTYHIVDFATGYVLRTISLPPHNYAETVGISEDNAYIKISYDDKVYIYSVETGQQVSDVNQNFIYFRELYKENETPPFEKDDDLYASYKSSRDHYYNERNLYVWMENNCNYWDPLEIFVFDANTKRKYKFCDLKTKALCRTYIYLEDDLYLAAAYSDGHIIRYSTQGEVLNRYNFDSNDHINSIHQQENLLLAFSDDKIYVYDLCSGKILKQFHNTHYIGRNGVYPYYNIEENYIITVKWTEEKRIEKFDLEDDSNFSFTFGDDFDLIDFINLNNTIYSLTWNYNNYLTWNYNNYADYDDDADYNDDNLEIVIMKWNHLDNTVETIKTGLFYFDGFDIEDLAYYFRYNKKNNMLYAIFEEDNLIHCILKCNLATNKCSVYYPEKEYNFDDFVLLYADDFDTAFLSNYDCSRCVMVNLKDFTLIEHSDLLEEKIKKYCSLDFEDGYICALTTRDTVCKYNNKGKFVTEYMTREEYIKSKDYQPFHFMTDTGVTKSDLYGELYHVQFVQNGESLIYTPEGFFCGSEWATQNLVYIVDGMDVIGIDQVYDTYYRPDLVAAKMRGEDISAYASSVRLASLVCSGRAPAVSLLDIPTESSGRDMTFDISVRNTGGGIGAVNLLLNGKAIRLSDGIASADGETISFRHTVTLQNGNNTLEAFALNGAGLVESVRSSAQVVWRGATEKPDLYVLTAAVNRYRDKSLCLNYAVPDAQSVAAGFQKQKSGLYRNVHISQLNDGEVTKEKLAAEFSRLSEHIRADDVFVFFVSGHGTTYDDGDYYYLPSDFRYTSKDSIPNGGISKNDLLANLSKIKAGKTLVMLDTCNSGAFLSDSNKRGLSEKTAIDRLTRATGHATLAASSDTQSAMEGYNGHGVFTYVFLEGIAGAADSDGDGYVTLNELSTFVEREVPERSYEKWGYEQVPQKDLRRQDFPIAGK